MNQDQRIANPPRYYKCPAAIIADKELTVAEQIAALENWRNDINLRLTATEENMGGNGTDLSLVSEIDNLLRDLPH